MCSITLDIDRMVGIKRRRKGRKGTQLIRQNFSKFLVKDGKIKWFPARTTKVVCFYSHVTAGVRWGKTGMRR